MIRHTFKLIWNRKRRNFLLLSEIFFSFIVLFAVASMAISSVSKYLEPLGFSCENVWVLYTGGNVTEEIWNRADIRAIRTQIEREMESCREIETVSWADFNHPYANCTFSTNFEHGGQEYNVDFFPADDNFATVLDIPVIEGRWFNREDDASSRTPIIINRRLKERLFGEESPVGQIHTKKDKEYIIIGVVGNYRYHGEFKNHREGFFQRVLISDTTHRPPEIALLAVRPGTGVQFEERLLKRLSAIAPGWNLRIENMEKLRAAYLKDYLMGTVLLVIVAGFLLFNVALGLFGVLWYSINRRRGEVGLRRALGAHAGHIAGQILGESLVLATFAIIVGVFVAVQVPIIGLEESIGTGVYLFAMLAAALLIYLLVTACALYPSHLAALIEPATALHNE